MERTIAIANQNTQERYTIKSKATTLGELQDEMTAQGINFTGMEFTEGISKTTLHGRDSQLPSNVMYKGKQTNDLVMLLTNPSKKISSGADTRKEAYEKIKEYNLQERVKELYGRNFTMVKTEELWNVINHEVEAEKDVDTEDTCEAPDNTLTSVKEQEDTFNLSINAALVKSLIDYLYNKRDLSVHDLRILMNLIQNIIDLDKEDYCNISDDDIDAIIAGN